MRPLQTGQIKRPTLKYTKIKMPHLKEEKQKQPLWKTWDYKAQKKGVRHTVYSVNGDQYTGEWLDNKKDGMTKSSFFICNIH